jgi:predicted nucleic acid-binding protein
METSSNLIIADSSALISLVIKSDDMHDTAVKLMQQIATDNRTVVIPCEIFAEMVNMLGKKFGHGQAIKAVEILLEGGVFVIEDTTDADRREALDWYGSMAESVSYTDCIVMVVATSSKTKEIFGFDDAFGKKGYLLPQLKQAA